MASSPEASLGEFLTGTEAKQIADRLGDGDTLTAALRVVSPGRRAETRSLVSALSHDDLIGLLRAIEGARSARTTVDPLWTMPGHLARNGRLTSSVTYLVERARHSVVCSTFNFQRSSGLWTALGAAARRPEIAMRVYMDLNAADRVPRPSSPTTAEVAAHLRPGVVLRTVSVRRAAGAEPLEVHLHRSPIPTCHQRELLLECGERQPGTWRARGQPQLGRSSRAPDERRRGRSLRTRPAASVEHSSHM